MVASIYQDIFLQRAYEEGFSTIANMLPFEIDDTACW